MDIYIFVILWLNHSRPDHLGRQKVTYLLLGNSQPCKKKLFVSTANSGYSSSGLAVTQPWLAPGSSCSLAKAAATLAGGAVVVSALAPSLLVGTHQLSPLRGVVHSGCSIIHCCCCPHHPVVICRSWLWGTGAVPRHPGALVVVVFIVVPHHHPSILPTLRAGAHSGGNGWWVGVVVSVVVRGKGGLGMSV
jgi:hypothetical protein